MQLPFENASAWCEEKGMRLVVVETVKELEALFEQTGPKSGKFRALYFATRIAFLIVA